MTDSVLHLVAGPNGAGKTTFYELVLYPVTRLRFINADVIAAELWPDAAEAHAYDAAALADRERQRLIKERVSFAAETVFSHPSKLDLLELARAAGYVVSLHVILIPEELSVARVVNRVANGGHSVPMEKIRARFARLWENLAAAIPIAHEATVYDNSSASRPYRVVARYEEGWPLGTPAWPPFTPAVLCGAGRSAQ